ncbi:MAG: TlpA disulfide reductase family protein [Gemmatimonadota bacterium]
MSEAEALGQESSAAASPEEPVAAVADGRLASDANSLRALGWAVAEPSWRLPSFNLEDDRGRSVSSSDLDGILTVVSFWASWCEGCEDELRALQALHSTADEADLMILPINTMDRKSRAAQIMEKTGFTVPVLWDKGLGREIGVVGLPTNYVVDRTGCVVALRYGPIEEANITKVLRILGRESPNQPC